jgi:hypothetical protein
MPGGSCGGGTAFATFDKACTDATNCSFGLHQINCCGSEEGIGFNHAQRAAFTAAEATWDASCAKCGCAAQPLRAEDGKTCDAAAITVMCMSNQCVTRCP